MKSIPLTLGSNANLSLSLWERLGEGIAQIVVHPPHPSSPSRERGSFLYEINPSPQGSNANLSLSLWERLGEGKKRRHNVASLLFTGGGKSPAMGTESAAREPDLQR